MGENKREHTSSGKVCVGGDGVEMGRQPALPGLLQVCKDTFTRLKACTMPV